MASQLSQDIQRSLWMDRKGHSGKQELEKRSIKADRVYKKREVYYPSQVEFAVTHDPKKTVKWLGGV